MVKEHIEMSLKKNQEITEKRLLDFESKEKLAQQKMKEFQDR
jgi:hypothetical protein